MKKILTAALALLLLLALSAQFLVSAAEPPESGSAIPNGDESNTSAEVSSDVSSDESASSIPDESSDTSSETSSDTSSDPEPEPQPGEGDTPFDYIDGYLYGLYPRTTVAVFAKMLGEAGGELTAPDGSVLDPSSNAYVVNGTGAVVGGNFYFVVIAGDVNSDGDVTATDYLLLKRHFVVPGSKALSEVALRASSLERTSVPTPSDYLKIKRYILTGLYDLVKNEPIQCTHEKWIDADCEQAKRCALCGKTEGKPLGHNWLAATCTESKRCQRCGKTEGEPLGHTYKPATMTEPKTCIVCGATSGLPVAQQSINSMLRGDPGSTNNHGTVVVNNTDYVIPAELLQKLSNKITQANDDLSFYVVDLNTYATIGYNIDREMNAACVVKAAYCLYVFQQIENGNGSLNEKLTFEARHYYPGSGTIKNSSFGTTFTLQEVLYRTIHISDNCGYYMLVDRFGRDGYNSWLDSLGVKYLHLLRSTSNWTSVSTRDLAIIWNEIYSYYQTGSSNAKIMFQYFLNAQHNYLKVQLPNYLVAHKSGWTETSFNDAGIVLEHNDGPYLIAILSSDPEGNILCPLARYLDEIMLDYFNWLD